MKVGFVSSILAEDTFHGVMSVASELKYNCVEMACWPEGGAERRYAGVSHIDVGNMDDAAVDYIKRTERDYGVEVSALAYYPNTMDNNLEKRNYYMDHLKRVIDASAKLDINLVTTFIGRDQYKTVEENLEEVKNVWPTILWYAEERGVRIAIENCPMLFGSDQWPGGQNLMTSPDIWEKIFEILPNENLGLNFDPSHFIWQGMDYIKPLYEFRDKLFHVHFKDIKIQKERLERVGILAYPLEYMTPKLPGLGDVQWDKFVAALKDTGYQGAACVEVEDRDYEENRESIIGALRESKKYLEQYL